jgi:predicted RNA-binding protein with PUA-like domain
MPTFLFKTEPTDFAFADLERAGRSTWDGVTNPTALIHLRSCALNDDVLIYHTADERAIVGLARVASAPREDPAAPGLNARGEPKLAVVDLVPVARAPRPVTLAAIKADPRFKAFDLVTQPRLSVMPVPPALARVLRDLAGV